MPLNNFMLIILLFQGGWTALMLGSYDGHKEIVKYLIKAKVSLDLQTQVHVVDQISKVPILIHVQNVCSD